MQDEDYSPTLDDETLGYYKVYVFWSETFHTKHLLDKYDNILIANVISDNIGVHQKRAQMISPRTWCA